MKTLITGASGFIGQHLCKALKKKGHEVFALTRKIQPFYIPGVHYIEADICSQDDLNYLSKGIDVFFHLASLSLAESEMNPSLAMKVNTFSMYNVIQASINNNIKKVIFTSTGQIYGGQSKLPNSERDAPNPDSVYGLTKNLAEKIASYFCKRTKIELVIFRLFNVFGLSANSELRNSVECVFINNILNNQQICIDCNNDSGRDFIYIDDVINALVSALQVDLEKEILNIGTGKITTILKLAQIINKIFNSNESINFNPTKNTREIKFQADILEARKKLGFKSQTTLEEGILKMKHIIINQSRADKGN